MFKKLQVHVAANINAGNAKPNISLFHFQLTYKIFDFAINVRNVNSYTHSIGISRAK